MTGERSRRRKLLLGAKWVCGALLLAWLTLDAYAAHGQIDLLDPQKPFGGAKLAPLSEEQARNAGLEAPRGMRFSEFLPDGSYSQAGVRDGDILLTLDGNEINSYDDFVGAFERVKLNDTVTLVVLRDGEELELQCHFAPISVAARLQAIREAAEKGAVDWQLYLYQVYEKGHAEVPNDLTEALRWLRHLAEGGHAGAQVELGKRHNHGNGVPRDPRAALEWAEKAAAQGNAEGQVVAGVVLSIQPPPELKDLARAAEYFKQAASQSNPHAWFYLGRMYRFGEYLEQDYDKAFRCFERAIELGELPAAHSELARAYESGQGATRNYPKALWHYRQAAKKGLAEAQYRVGFFHHLGYAVEKNEQEAVKWYELAAEQGHDMAMNNLGNLLLHSQTISQDRATALKLFQQAKAKGNLYAYYNLGTMYLQGTGVEKDLAKAGENLHQAAKGGHAHAQAELGAMILNGQHYQQSDAKALGWIQKAANQQHPGAERILGWMYENGRGVPKDRVEAIAWYLKAAEHGDEFAKKRLQELQQ